MLKLGSRAIGKLTMGIDFDHFGSVDAPLHEIVVLIAQGLESNKRIAAVGSWYAKMPFGEPRLLRRMQARLDWLMRQKIAETARGKEDLDLQDAALKADHLIGASWAASPRRRRRRLRRRARRPGYIHLSALPPIGGPLTRGPRAPKTDYFVRATDGEGNKLPPEQYAQTLVVATGAGYTTTSSLLSWLIYGLVRYPGNQEHLLQELVDNGFSDDLAIDADFVDRLSFLDKYIKKTQRRHNPSYQPGRTAQVDMVLPGGYRLPKGAVVIPALHHIHNNEELWDSPGRFDPDRWDTDRVHGRAPGTYMPFATGPRGCVGFNFALQEARIFLCKLVWRYHFTLAQDGVVEYDPYFQLIRPNNLYVHAQRRVKWPPKSE